MKFTIERRALLGVLTMAKTVVESRNTIPILAHIAIAATAGGGLRIGATDLDIQIDQTVAAEVAAAGALTVNASIFHDIVRKLPDGAQIECAIDGNSLTAKSGRSRFKLQTLSHEDFPDLAIGETPHGFEVDSKALHRMIGKVMFAVSTEETRYYLNGVYLDFGQPSDLRAVATDGYRLAMAWLPKPGGADGAPGIIVPRKTCQALMKLLDGKSVPLRVSLNAGKIIFEWPGCRVVSKLIDGTYPDYERVIPRGNNNNIVIVDTSELAKTIDRVSVIAAEKGQAIKLQFSGNHLVCSIANADAGTAEDSLGIEYGGPDIEIGLNSRYIAGALANVDGERVRLEMETRGDPVLLKPEDGLQDYKMVVMPMRV